MPSPSSGSVGQAPGKLASITVRTTAAPESRKRGGGEQGLDLLVTRAAFIHGAEPAAGRETTA